MRKHQTLFFSLLFLCLSLLICGCTDTAQPPADTENDTAPLTQADVTSAPGGTDPVIQAPTAPADTAPDTDPAETTSAAPDDTVPEALDWFKFSETGDRTMQATKEQKQKTATVYDGYMKDLSTFPVSFSYDKKKYTGLGGLEELSRTAERTDAAIKTTIVLKLDDTIHITLVTSIYPDYCAYEWTLYFTNVGDQPSGVLRNINGADVRFVGDQPLLLGITSDGGEVQDGELQGYYKPYSVDLTQGKHTDTNVTGRPTERTFPYYNLQYGDGGTYVAIGWGGAWTATFAYEEGTTTLTAGQKNFSAYLKPGETVRSPLCAFLAYEGRDTNVSTNLWRRWFIDCNMPRVEGEVVPAMTAGITARFTNEMVNTNESEQIFCMRKFVEKDVPIDCWWMDAGWYFRNGEETLSTWLETGNWKVDTRRFPSGLRNITLEGQQHGIKTMLWFEPELIRIPNALLDPDGLKPEWILGQDGTWRILNLGCDEAVDWVVARVSTYIEKTGIRVYRQDYGHGDPLSFWLQNDEKDRRGITENLCVQGHYKFWDTLLQKYPDLIIDTCASGGGRLDLETLCRSVPMHKTDLSYSEYDIKQDMHQSLYAWIPYFGTVTNTSGSDLPTTYGLRSSYCSFMAIAYDVRQNNLDWDIIRNGDLECRSIFPYLNAEYYPLLDWNRGTTAWRGWIFFDPNTDSGVIQLFRPANCSVAQMNLPLYGVDPAKTYTLTDADGRFTFTVSGEQLLSGISFPMETAGYAAVIFIAPVV